MNWRPTGRRTIATRLLAWFLVMASLPLIVVLFLSTRKDESDLRSDAYATVTGAAQAKADGIEAFTTEHREAAGALARTPAVADRFRRLEVAVRATGVDSAEYAQVEASLRPFFSRYLRDFGFTDLFLVATTGEGVFAVNEREGLGFNYDTGPFKGTERAAAFRQVRDSRALTLVGFDSFSLNSRSAYIGIPLNDASGVIGVAVFEVGKEPIFAIVGDHGGLGETGESVLGARRESAVIIVAPTRFDDALPRGRRIALGGKDDAGLQAAVDGRPGRGPGRDYRGRSVLAAWRPVPSLGLGLEVKKDVSEVLAPVREQRRTLLQLAVLGLPLLAAGALLAARSVSKPITRLTAATRTISAGNRELQVPVDRDDEVGELSQAFNTMMAELAASYASVEETVRIRTAELALLQGVAVAANEAATPEEATRRALELVCRHTGWPVGHALLVRRLPGELPIAISGRVWFMADPDRYERFRSVTDGMRMPAGVGLPGKVLASGQAEWAIDPDPDDPDYPRAAAAFEAGLRIGMAFPVMISRDIVAMLEFFAPDTIPPDPALMSLMNDVGTQIGRVVERMQADDALRAAKDAAEVANQAKSTFLASMSHELRTPLNAIIGYAEMLEEEAADTGQGELLPDLGKIRSAGRHLLGVINDVLDLSKIEAGRTDLYLETFPVATLIDEVAATVRPLAEENGNRLEVRLTDDLGEMHSDLTKVRQTLLNLAGNASKFTEGGTVTLAARRDGDDVVFMVSDTGIGIAPEHMDRLFQPFSQAESSTARRFGGTGLGLVISRRFCQMLGGDVTVHSAAGVGSTFTVRLPAELGEPQPVEEITLELPVERSDSAVLVIEDDAVTLEMLRRMLEKEGFAVVTAAHGRAGLEQLADGRPSLILLDLLMPQMNGFEFLAELQSRPDWRTIPVVVVTGKDLTAEEQARLSGRVAEVLRKGAYTRERLLSEVRERVAAWTASKP